MLRCYARDVYHSNAVFMLLLCNAVFMLLLCCLSLTCGRRHIEFNVATQCLCCCYVVYRSHVAAAILFWSWQRSVYVVAMLFIAHMWAPPY